MTSCKKDESISFGTVEYYPGFLWSDPNLTPVTKTFDFDFSPDAKSEASFAEFQFVDNDDKPISTSIMQVIIDGKEITNNRFKISSDVTSKEITFKFSPDAESRKYQGYLKLVDHTLDRIDSQPLQAGQQINAFQWTLVYEKEMNPLAKLFMWILFIIASSLAIWFAIMRSIVYPRFKSIKKGFYFKNYQPITINFKGSRLVVLDNKVHKQSYWDRIFKGKILYKQHPAFHTPIFFLPRKNGVLVKTDFTKYKVSVNPIPRIGTSEITDIINNHKITIQ